MPHPVVITEGFLDVPLADVCNVALEYEQARSDCRWGCRCMHYLGAHFCSQPAVIFVRWVYKDKGFVEGRGGVCLCENHIAKYKGSPHYQEITRDEWNTMNVMEA